MTRFSFNPVTLTATPPLLMPHTPLRHVVEGWSTFTDRGTPLC